MIANITSCSPPLPVRNSPEMDSRCHCRIIPASHHNRPSPRFDCQQCDPQSQRHGLLPHSHCRSVCLGIDFDLRHDRPSRNTSLSHQKQQAREGSQSSCSNPKITSRSSCRGGRALGDSGQSRVRAQHGQSIIPRLFQR